MLTMTTPGQTAQASERPQRRWWWLMVWLAGAAALGFWVVAGLWAPSAEEPGSGAVDPLDAYTMTEADPVQPSILRNMPGNYFYQASGVVIHRDGEKVGELTALELTPSTLVGLDLDAFLRQATLSDYRFQGTAEDAIDMRIIGSTRVAAVFPLYPGVGGRFSAWVQDGSLMVLTSIPTDWTLADQFLQDYLATPPVLPAAEYTMTATDLPVTSIFENMPAGTFDQGSVVAVTREGEEVGDLTTLTLTQGAQRDLNMGDLDLDTFLKDAIMSESTLEGLAREYIDMRMLGSTRVAAVYPFGSLFAVWVQDGSLKVFQGGFRIQVGDDFNSLDRSLADHFLRDYLGTARAIPAAERTD
jgi:hypothetical protein